jgi:hypothetical protein
VVEVDTDAFDEGLSVRRTVEAKRSAILVTNIDDVLELEDPAVIHCPS